MCAKVRRKGYSACNLSAGKLVAVSCGALTVSVYNGVNLIYYYTLYCSIYTFLTYLSIIAILGVWC